MNILYHALVGGIGEIFCPSHGIFFLFSILPDFPLLWNEIKLRWYKQRFNPWLVSPFVMNCYRLTHSSFVTIVLLNFSHAAALAHFIHTFADWFTHTGRFSAMPFYPMSYWRVRWGRNILK